MVITYQFYGDEAGLSVVQYKHTRATLAVIKATFTKHVDNNNNFKKYYNVPGYTVC